MKVDLSVKICNKKLSNPLILASGLFGTEAELMLRVAKAGASAVTSKSCNLEGRQGYENPTILAWDKGLINAVGLTNPGIEKEISEIKKLRNLLGNSGVLIIASIFGADIKEVINVSKKIQIAKPDFLELNVSCPHVDPKVKGQFYNNPDALSLLIKSVKKAIKIPLIVKLSPNVENIGSIAQAAETAGADAISAINTLGPGMLIDIEAGKPILSNKVGGLSGPAVKPIAIRCIYDIYKAVKIPIIGMGGITTGKDAIEMIMAGATALGIGSGIYYRGINIFKKVLKEMKEIMVNQGFKSLNEIRGIAHE